jgi:hypothetical protein
MVLLEYGKKTTRSSVFRLVRLIGFYNNIIINLSDSEDDGILLPQCCPMDPFSSLEVSLEATTLLPNLELPSKPAGGDTVVSLDWLATTDPNNLYPFVIVLPSTHIFVGKVEIVLV